MGRSDIEGHYEQQVASQRKMLLDSVGGGWEQDLGIYDAQKRQAAEEMFFQEGFLPNTENVPQEAVSLLNVTTSGISQDNSLSDDAPSATASLSTNEEIYEPRTTVVVKESEPEQPPVPDDNTVPTEESAEPPAPDDSTVSTEDGDHLDFDINEWFANKQPNPFSEDDAGLSGGAKRKAERLKGLEESSGIADAKAKRKKEQEEQKKRGLKQGEKPIPDWSKQDGIDHLMKMQGGKGLYPAFMGGGYAIGNKSVTPMQDAGVQRKDEIDVGEHASFAAEEVENAAVSLVGALQRFMDIAVYLKSEVDDINETLDHSFGG